MTDLTQDQPRRFSPLLLIFLTVLIDLIGFGIVIPILPLYAKSPKFQADPLLIGQIIGIFSLAQFIFTPILGRWSDRIGRKPVLIASLLGTALSFVMMGLAGSLWMLFVARILDGISGGNISTAQAYIADVTKPEDRAKGMGLIGAAFGLGFIIGPFIGGELGHFGLSVPFYFAAAIAVLNALSIWLLLPETLTPEKRLQLERQGAARNPLTLIRESLSENRVRKLLLIYFLLTLAFATYQSIFALFAQVRFASTPRDIGRILAVVGLIAAVIQGGLIGKFAKRYGEKPLLIAGLMLMIVASIIMPTVQTVRWMMLVLGMLTIGSAMTSSLLPALISRITSSEKQGSTLGITQSAGSLARYFGPALGGTLFSSFDPNAPFILCAGLTVLTLLFSTTNLSSNHLPTASNTSSSRD
jgi:DHA1 family tetracycline resistance protein-like MFS transporter